MNFTNASIYHPLFKNHKIFSKLTWVIYIQFVVNGLENGILTIKFLKGSVSYIIVHREQNVFGC